MNRNSKLLLGGLLIGILIVSVITSMNYSTSKYTQDNNISTSILNLPFGWEFDIKDIKGCYSVRVLENGKYSGSLEDYIKESLNIEELNQVIDETNPYNLDEFNSDIQVFTLGQMGVHNINVIYLMNNMGNIYTIEINSINADNNTSNTCESPEKLIKHIINSLTTS